MYKFIHLEHWFKTACLNGLKSMVSQLWIVWKLCNFSKSSYIVSHFSIWVSVVANAVIQVHHSPFLKAKKMCNPLMEKKVIWYIFNGISLFSSISHYSFSFDTYNFCSPESERDLFAYLGRFAAYLRQKHYPHPHQSNSVCIHLEIDSNTNVYPPAKCAHILKMFSYN